MDTLLNQYYWMRDNYVEMFTSLMIIVIAMQSLVKLTPTKADDSFLERVNAGLEWAMKFLKIPNVKREDGSLMPAGKHEDPAPK